MWMLASVLAGLSPEAGVGGWVRQLRGGVRRGYKRIYSQWEPASHCPSQLSCVSVYPLLASY